MHKYRVTVGTRSAARLDFEVMAPSSTAAFMQSLDLTEEGERVTVLALDPLDAQRERLFDAMAPEVGDD